MHCLTLVDFAGDPSDKEKLYKLKKGEEQKREELRLAVSRLVNAATDKLFEFEGTTAKAQLKAKKGNTPGTSFLGLAKRITAYRTRIRDDLGLGKNLKQSDVALIDFDDLMRRKKEKEAPAAPTALDSFTRRGSNNDN